MVTIPIVRMPKSFATRAITGAAPVPVPPPIPAVMKTMRVPSLNKSCIKSMLSSAALRATSGLLPAPKPPVVSSPNCTLIGTGDFDNA